MSALIRNAKAALVAMAASQNILADDANDHVESLRVPSGKEFAMWWHNYVCDDFDATQALFDRHPSWRHA